MLFYLTAYFTDLIEEFIKRKIFSFSNDEVQLERRNVGTVTHENLYVQNHFEHPPFDSKLYVFVIRNLVFLTSHQLF